MQLITDVEQVNDSWLTACLREAGVLPQGKVIHLAHDVSQPSLAVTSRCTVTYSEDALVDAPRHLFVKISPPERSGNIPEQGKREILFYQCLMGQTEIGRSLPIVRCYDACYDDPTGQFHLLLDDVSLTHGPLPLGLPPDREQSDLAVQTLAAVHALWWNSPNLARFGSLPTVESDAEHILADRWGEFVNQMGDRLSPAHRAIYERVMAAWPQLSRRYVETLHWTLSHGDAHVWNFLYPHQPGLPAYLVDWEALGIKLGTDDLAYMMTLFWFPERRARLEEPLLREYHTHLLERGVRDYSWAQCWEDYRLSVIRMVFQPIWWWSTDHPAWLWWDRMERVVLAYEDLSCEELLSA